MSGKNNNASHSSALSELNNEQIKKILGHFQPFKVMRGENLLQEGSVCKHLYYVQSGCIRTFFIDKEGLDKTSYVIASNNFGTAWASFIYQQPSAEFIEAAENSELLAISHKEFFNFVHTDSDWKDFYLQILELAYLNQSRKIEALMTLNARQRYQKLMKGNPSLIQKLSNKTLASFLDMREETLSRIKKK